MAAIVVDCELGSVATVGRLTAGISVATVGRLTAGRRNATGGRLISTTWLLAAVGRFTTRFRRENDVPLGLGTAATNRSRTLIDTLGMSIGISF